MATLSIALYFVFYSSRVALVQHVEDLLHRVIMMVLLVMDSKHRSKHSLYS